MFWGLTSGAPVGNYSVGNVDETIPHTQRVSYKCQVGSGCRWWVWLGKGSPRRPAHRGETEAFSQLPSPTSERHSHKRASLANTKGESIPTSVICPVAAFTVQVTCTGRSTSFEVRQSRVLTPALFTSGVNPGKVTTHVRTQFPGL